MRFLAANIYWRIIRSRKGSLRWCEFFSDSKLLKNESGTAVVEFSVIAPLFFIVFMTMIEFGVYMYHRMVIEDITTEVSRVIAMGKKESPECIGYKTSSAFIKCFVKSKASVLINGSDAAEVQVKTLSNQATVAPDICLDTSIPSSAPAKCKKYIDINNNGAYEGIGASNLGGGSDLMEVRVSYPLDTLFAYIGKFLSGGNSSIVMISAVTVVKNEPFGAAK